MLMQRFELDWLKQWYDVGLGNSCLSKLVWLNWFELTKNLKHAYNTYPLQAIHGLLGIVDMSICMLALADSYNANSLGWYWIFKSVTIFQTFNQFLKCLFRGNMWCCCDYGIILVFIWYQHVYDAKSTE